MRIRVVIVWSSRGISKDPLTRSSCFPYWYTRPFMGPISMSPVLAYTKVDLQRKCKKRLCAMERLSRIVWPILALPPFTAGVLIELLTSRAILPRSCSDSFDGVRKLACRLKVRLKAATLWFYY